MRVQFCILGHIGTLHGMEPFNWFIVITKLHKNLFFTLCIHKIIVLYIHTKKKTTIQQLVHYTLNPFVLLKIHDTKIIHKSLTKQINLSVVPKSSTTTKKCIKTTRGGKQSLSTTL
jgi:hypothetical protein